jgi:hypothetical protein
MDHRDRFTVHCDGYDRMAAELEGTLSSIIRPPVYPPKALTYESKKNPAFETGRTDAV